MIGRSASDSGYGSWILEIVDAAVEPGGSREPAEFFWRHSIANPVTKEQWNIEIASRLCAKRVGAVFLGIEKYKAKG